MIEKYTCQKVCADVCYVDAIDILPTLIEVYLQKQY